jgi:hypothetical protein
MKNPPCGPVFIRLLHSWRNIEVSLSAAVYGLVSMRNPTSSVRKGRQAAVCVAHVGCSECLVQ